MITKDPQSDFKKLVEDKKVKNVAKVLLPLLTGCQVVAYACILIRVAFAPHGETWWNCGGL